MRTSTPFRLCALVLPLFLLAGCSLLRPGEKIPAVVGAWEYTVKDTPQGDAPGSLTVTYLDGVYTGELVVDVLLQRVPITDVSFEENVFTFTAVLDINGQESRTVTTATIDGDTMTGEIDVPGFGTFPLEGSKKVMEAEE